jgi:hypothetical protein
MIKTTLRTHGVHRTAAAAAAITGALLFAACASTPPEPTVALTAAEQAIATADRTPATKGVTPELTEAREKLTAAHAAAQKKDMVLSERLAKESRIDAELALARSQAAAAQTVNDEMKRSNATLAQEMQRNSGAGK